MLPPKSHLLAYTTKLIYFCFDLKKIDTPNFDRINPATCVNAKIRRLHRKINAIYMEKFKPYGIQGSMLSILFIIGKQSTINQKTLADMLVLDPSTMSRDVKKLSTKGWVQINKGDDPRNSELSITTKGYLLIEEIAPIWESLHNKVHTLLGNFSIQQIDSITEAISRETENLRA